MKLKVPVYQESQLIFHVYFVYVKCVDTYCMNIDLVDNIDFPPPRTNNKGGLYTTPKNSIKEVQALLFCVYTQIQNKITIACISMC